MAGSYPIFEEVPRPGAVMDDDHLADGEIQGVEEGIVGGSEPHENLYPASQEFPPSPNQNMAVDFTDLPEELKLDLALDATELVPISFGEGAVSNEPTPGLRQLPETDGQDEGSSVVDKNSRTKTIKRKSESEDDNEENQAQKKRKPPRQHSAAARDAAENYTLPIPGQTEWSIDNLPDILYQFKPPAGREKRERPQATKPSPFDGEPPLTVFDILPDRISSNVEEFRVEAWLRLDRRIQLEDITMRMHPAYRVEKNTLQQRGVRFRQKFKMLAWGSGSKKTQEMEDALIREMKQKGIDPKSNSTRGLTPGLINPKFGEAGGRIPVPEQYRKNKPNAPPPIKSNVDGKSVSTPTTTAHATTTAESTVGPGLAPVSMPTAYPLPPVNGATDPYESSLLQVGNTDAVRPLVQNHFPARLHFPCQSMIGTSPSGYVAPSGRGSVPTTTDPGFAGTNGYSCSIDGLGVSQNSRASEISVPAFGFDAPGSSAVAGLTSCDDPIGYVSYSGVHIGQGTTNVTQASDLAPTFSAVEPNDPSEHAASNYEAHNYVGVLEEFFSGPTTAIQVKLSAPENAVPKYAVYPNGDFTYLRTPSWMGESSSSLNDFDVNANAPAAPTVENNETTENSSGDNGNSVQDISLPTAGPSVRITGKPDSQRPEEVKYDADRILARVSEGWEVMRTRIRNATRSDLQSLWMSLRGFLQPPEETQASEQIGVTGATEENADIVVGEQTEQVNDETQEDDETVYDEDDKDGDYEDSEDSECYQESEETDGSESGDDNGGGTNSGVAQSAQNNQNNQTNQGGQNEQEEDARYFSLGYWDQVYSQSSFDSLKLQTAPHRPLRLVNQRSMDPLHRFTYPQTQNYYHAWRKFKLNGDWHVNMSTYNPQAGLGAYTSMNQSRHYSETKLNGPSTCFCTEARERRQRFD
ncbi:hypothetical protein VTO42DRAFT_7521 [Malbranchea cinnamomea]